jgi:hypothetical protein
MCQIADQVIGQAQAALETLQGDRARLKVHILLCVCVSDVPFALVSSYSLSLSLCLSVCLSVCLFVQRVRRGLLDIANTLGVSTSVMRWIQRREWGDRMIVYGCMVFTLAFFFFAVFYLRDWVSGG